MKNFLFSKCSILFAAVLLLLQAASVGQTLTGYTNSSPLSNLTLNSEEALALFAEWQNIMSPNLDDLPSARETEIYQMLMRAEKGDGPVTFSYKENRWLANGLVEDIDRIEFSQDLAWLLPAIHGNDKLLALRNPFNDTCVVTGGTPQTWLHNGNSGPGGINTYGGDGKISPMGLGVPARSVSRMAEWILDHPELYPQVVPLNAAIPQTFPGDTYYDRAKFYLEEVKKSYEICISAGMHWEFDSSDNGYAWVWKGDPIQISALTSARANYPGGIAVADIRDVAKAEGFSLHAYNRVFAYASGYQKCAEGLQRIDAIEGTSVHRDFCATAFDFVEKTLNSYRFWRVVHNEAEPNGISSTWGYSPSGLHEDRIHFYMDLDFMEIGLRNLLNPTDLHEIAGTAFSRHFDAESHVFFAKIGRQLKYDTDTGEVMSPFQWKSIGNLSWIGEGGSHGHMQGAVALSLEIFNEQMRKMTVDSDFRDSTLGRADTRRTRQVKGPFEIYDLKLERKQRGFTPTPGGNNPPVFISAAPLSVASNAPLGSVFGSVSATDPDAGQTIRYWITAGNIDNRFKIDSNTGVIRVNHRDPLDFSENPLTSLEITVMDDGIPMGLASTTVDVSYVTTPTNPTEMLINGSFDSGFGNFAFMSNRNDISLAPIMPGRWISSEKDAASNRIDVANISSSVTGQSGTNSLLFQSDEKRGLVQLVDVSNRNLNGSELTFSLAFAAPGREAESVIDVCTYQVVGFDDLAGLTADLDQKYEFTGGSYDVVVAQRTIANHELSDSAYTIFNEQVTLDVNYNYLAVLIGGVAGVSGSDTQHLAVDGVQLLLSDPPLETVHSRLYCSPERNTCRRDDADCGL